MSVVTGSVTSVKRGIRMLLLGAAFAQVLQDVQAEFADGLQMPELRGVDTAEKRTLGEWPRAELLAVQTVRVGDSAWSPQRDHVIVVRFYVGGDSEELITEQVERYILATRRLFEAAPGDEARLFPYVAGSVDCGLEDYDPIVTEKATDRLVKAGTIELLVHTTT